MCVRERERGGLCVCVFANTTITHRVYTCTSMYVCVSINSTQTFELIRTTYEQH